MVLLFFMVPFLFRIVPTSETTEPLNAAFNGYGEFLCSTICFYCPASLFRDLIRSGSGC